MSTTIQQILPLVGDSETREQDRERRRPTLVSRAWGSIRSASNLTGLSIEAVEALVATGAVRTGATVPMFRSRTWSTPSRSRHPPTAHRPLAATRGGVRRATE